MAHEKRNDKTVVTQFRPIFPIPECPPDWLRGEEGMWTGR
jgi:hypothetical protein